MKIVHGLLIMLVVVVMAGCSALGSLGNIFGSQSNKVEAFLAAQVAGQYVVEIRKDGDILLSESWECTKDAESGKLTGCHKQ